ncbi:FIG01219977: hypothetical protein [Citrobacter freundii]|uniref:Peptidase M15C domain-containing protein n=3 Tax=Citrobacter freundii TaxID=546 RepID=A0A7G2IWJ1_CITFR|nr:FIG01219977: hypothetical protein [Citrobacter freundii]
MTLSEKQQLFTVMVANLIHWAEERGYRLTFGEAFRTPEQAALNAKKGSGISNSLHTQRLAVDFNLFVNGQYQTRTEDYLPLGEYWESLGGSWGGRSNPDRMVIISAWNITGCADESRAVAGCGGAGVCLGLADS